VADGRTRHHAGATYSATSSREDFFILFYIIAAFDWDYAHIDEMRVSLKEMKDNVLKENDNILIVYDYVDDFTFTGNSLTVIDDTHIARFRQLCKTTHFTWDA